MGGVVLYKGKGRITADCNLPLSHIVCPEHPDVKWWKEIDLDHGWAEVFTEHNGKQTGVTKIINFKYIEVWMEDSDGAISLDRAMGH